MSWVVVVPVKGTARAKSRLGAHPERVALAEAFALDTVTVLLAAPAVTRVFVVTADDEIAARMSALGAHIIREQSVPRDSGPEPSDPLNSAIRQGIAAARAALPASNLAVVTGDLPALTVADVEHALALAAAHERSMIPDEEGAGTTALLARAGIDFTPQFGAGSRVAHPERNSRRPDAAGRQRGDRRRIRLVDEPGVEHPGHTAHADSPARPVVQPDGRR